MNLIIEILKAIVLGVVEGITEWLPISSTGHMILVDEFLHLNVTPQFKEMFLVVIQLGAILAVVVLYWHKLWPFGIENKRIVPKKDIWQMWFKVLVSCVPAAVVGVLFDDKLNALFYNWQTVAIMLILCGIFFLVVETWNKGKTAKIHSIGELTYTSALIIGAFQVLSLIPGTSRSGSTILGAMLIGISRPVAAEFSFFMSIPVMFGASFLKLIKFGFHYTGTEVAVLLVGMITAFIVSVLAIRFLMGYIRKRDFTAFGIYRIVLGVLVVAYFMIK